MATVMPVKPAMSVRPEDAAALQGIVKSLSESWARQDADTLAQLYAEDASVVLPGDTYLKGRQAIRDWMANAFATKWNGTQVLGLPLELRYASSDVCVMVSQGGAYRPGASEVSVDDAIRGMWVFLRRETGWTITAYENTPLRAVIPIPTAQK